MTTAVHNAITDLTRKVECLKIDVDAINAFINENKKLMDEVLKKENVPEEFKNLSSNVSNYIKKSELNNIAHQGIFREIRSGIEELRSVLFQHSSSIEDHEREVSSISEKIASIFEIFKRNQDLLMSTMNQRLALAEEDHEKKYEEFRASISTSPRSILDINQKIVKKLEDSTLNYQNAMKVLKHLGQKIEEMKSS